MIRIDPDGTAGEVVVVESSGHDILDDAAKRWYEKVRFKPATLDGKPVSVVAYSPLPFKLQ
jgi:periplasmic protein TonB